METNERDLLFANCQKISKMPSQISFCAPLVSAFANASRLSKLMFPVNILNVLFTNIVSSLRISFSFGVSLSWYSGCFLFAPLVFWCSSSFSEILSSGPLYSHSVLFFSHISSFALLYRFWFEFIRDWIQMP